MAKQEMSEKVEQSEAVLLTFCGYFLSSLHVVEWRKIANVPIVHTCLQKQKSLPSVMVAFSELFITSFVL